MEFFVFILQSAWLFSMKLVLIKGEHFNEYKMLSGFALHQGLGYGLNFTHPTCTYFPLNKTLQLLLWRIISNPPTTSLPPEIDSITPCILSAVGYAHRHYPLRNQC